MNIGEFRAQTAHLDDQTPLVVLLKPTETGLADHIVVGHLRNTNKDVIVVCPAHIKPADSLLRDLEPSKLM